MLGFNGLCDDGGASHVVGACPYGTDCADCGVRCLPLIAGGDAPLPPPPLASLPTPTPPAPPLTPAPPVWPLPSSASPATAPIDVPPGCLCSDDCAGRPGLARNGECNDGGALNLAGGLQALDAQCALGADCTDCGLRCPLLFTIPSPPPSPLPRLPPDGTLTQVGGEALGGSPFGFRSQVAVAVAASVFTGVICLVLLAITLRRRWPRRSHRLHSAYAVGGTELIAGHTRRRPFGGGRVVQAKVLAVERVDRGLETHLDGERRLSGTERTPPRTSTLNPASPAGSLPMSPAELLLLRKENALLRELFLVNSAAPRSSMPHELAPPTSLAEEQQSLVMDGEDLDLSRV